MNPTTGWLPIDTAPHDGAWVLVSGFPPIDAGDEDYSDLPAVMARYVRRGKPPIYVKGKLVEWEACITHVIDDWYGGKSTWAANVYPSLWMPLPEAPGSA